MSLEVRNSALYRAKRIVKNRTVPAPEGRPGFIRIDSVHQGDLDGVKGVLHINAVDCVTQWDVVTTLQGLT